MMMTSHRRAWLTCGGVLVALFAVLACVLVGAGTSGAAPETTTTAAPTAPGPTSTVPTPATAAPATAAPATTAVPSSAAPSSSSTLDKIESAASCTFNLVGCAVSKVASSAGSSLLDGAATTLATFLQKILEWCMSWWIKLPTPGLQNASTQLLSGVNLAPLQIAVATASLLFFAVRIVVSRQSSIHDDFAEGVTLMLRMVGGAAVLPGLLILGGQAGDEVGVWLLDQANVHDGTAVKGLLALDVLTGPAGPGSLALIVLCVIGVLGALLQMLFLIFRACMLLVIVGALPFAAGGSGTGVGSQAFQRMLAFGVAFCLYKPIGALVYLIAFKAADQSNATQDPQLAILGLLLLMLAGFVMPALMKLLAGGTLGGMGSGASGLAAAAGVAAAGMAVASMGAGAATGGASGAVGASMASRGGGGGGGGGTPQGPGPQPAPMGESTMPQGSSTPDGSDPGAGRSSGSNSGSGASSALSTAADASALAGAAGNVMNGDANSTPSQLPPPPTMRAGYGDAAAIR